jgi:hypothetical protein
MRFQAANVEFPISSERGDSLIETFPYEGREVRVSRTRCVDKRGPYPNGLYEFYYEYDLYEFMEGPETLHARSYTTEPEEAHLLAIEIDGQRQLLSRADLGRPLVKAALEYFRHAGKTRLDWLDSANEENGYSSAP